MPDYSMSGNPLLVIQMHRLGDLVLTFPLLLDLKRRYPDCPLWMVAEPAFFEPLMPLAPQAVFFSPAHLPVLAKEKFTAIFNLDSGNMAATCTAQAVAPFAIGPMRRNNETVIKGFWQLYRAALTQNNRHNIFHWADLNRLDLGFPLTRISRQAVPRPATGRIGLFIGASEPAKRPDNTFWINLARRLKKDGFKPILLGGPAEKAAGQEIAAKTGLNAANFCGRTTLAQLAAITGKLDLLITPDTGPMHLADWLGAPVLNLSMGNVHAAETGPVSPGQVVMRANMSCTGCWQCGRSRLYCKQAFTAGAVSRAARAMTENRLPEFLAENPLPGLELFMTGRHENGLHKLVPLGQTAPNCRMYLENFWQSAFLHFHDSSQTGPAVAENAKRLYGHYPYLAENMGRNFADMLGALAGCARSSTPLPENFWKNQPLHSRLFAGQMQMSLQNDNFSRSSILESIDRIVFLRELFAAAR